MRVPLFSYGCQQLFLSILMRALLIRMRYLIVFTCISRMINELELLFFTGIFLSQEILGMISLSDEQLKFLTSVDCPQFVYHFLHRAGDS